MPSIDGLGSGLDTSTIISQLMSLERQPQQRLTARRTAVLAEGTAWGQIETNLKALGSASAALAQSGLAATRAGSSAPTTATITGSATSSTGTFTLEVTRLARAHQLQSTAFPARTALVGPGDFVVASGAGTVGATAVAVAGANPGTYRIEVRSDGVLVNGVKAEVQTAEDGSVTVAGIRLATSAGLRPGTTTVSVARTTDTTTVEQLAAAVNAARGGATAVAVDDGTGSVNLVLSATRTGAAQALLVGGSLSGLDSTAFTGNETVLARLDASLTFAGVPVTRGSNTITDLVPGATVTLLQQDPGKPLTLSVTEDTAKVVSSVKGLVDAVNTALRALGSSTKYDVATGKGGALVGDAGARALVSRIQDAMSSATSGEGGVTLSALGVTLQRDGTYAFSEPKLTAALADTRGAAERLVTSLTSGLKTLADQATGSTGVVATGRDSASTTAARLQKQVDAWDGKLTLVESRLRKQFTALDTALSGLKSQGTWLAGQLSGLPTWK